MNEPSKEEIINDMNGYMVSLYRVVKHHLAELAKSIQGNMIISINNHLGAMVLFNGLNLKEVDHKYTVGGGAKAVAVKELIYTNF